MTAVVAHVSTQNRFSRLSNDNEDGFQEPKHRLNSKERKAIKSLNTKPDSPVSSTANGVQDAQLASAKPDTKDLKETPQLAPLTEPATDAKIAKENALSPTMSALQEKLTKLTDWSEDEKSDAPIKPAAATDKPDATDAPTDFSYGDDGFEAVNTQTAVVMQTVAQKWKKLDNKDAQKLELPYQPKPVMDKETAEAFVRTFVAEAVDAFTYAAEPGYKAPDEAHAWHKNDVVRAWIGRDTARPGTVGVDQFMQFVVKGNKFGYQRVIGIFGQTPYKKNEFGEEKFMYSLNPRPQHKLFETYSIEHPMIQTRNALRKVEGFEKACVISHANPLMAEHPSRIKGKAVMPMFDNWGFLLAVTKPLTIEQGIECDFLDEEGTPKYKGPACFDEEMFVEEERAGLKKKFAALLKAECDKDLAHAQEFANKFGAKKEKATIPKSLTVDEYYAKQTRLREEKLRAEEQKRLAAAKRAEEASRAAKEREALLKKEKIHETSAAGAALRNLALKEAKEGKFLQSTGTVVESVDLMCTTTTKDGLKFRADPTNGEIFGVRGTAQANNRSIGVSLLPAVEYNNLRRLPRAQGAQFEAFVKVDEVRAVIEKKEGEVAIYCGTDFAGLVSSNKPIFSLTKIEKGLAHFSGANKLTFTVDSKNKFTFVLPKSNSK